MATVRDLIVDAYQENGILGAEEEPDADQLDVGLRRLNNLYKSLFSNELGEPLLPVNYGVQGIDNVFGIIEDQSADIVSTFIPVNSRLIFNLGAAATLYLDPNPRDGARFGVIDNGGNLATYNVTIKPNGRRIETASTLTLNTNSLNREWFYRGDLGNWVRVIDLALDDTSPLPAEFDDMLITLLNVRLNPRHGAKTSEEMVEVLKRMRRQFRARYHQVKEQSSELGLYRLSSNKNYSWRWSDVNA